MLVLYCKRIFVNTYCWIGIKCSHRAPAHCFWSQENTPVPMSKGVSWVLKTHVVSPQWGASWGGVLLRVMDCFSRANSSNRQSYHPFFTQSEVLREIECLLFSDVVLLCVKRCWAGKQMLQPGQWGGRHAGKLPNMRRDQLFLFLRVCQPLVLEPGACASHELDIVHSSPAGGTKRQIDSAGLTVQSSSLVPFHPLPPKTTTTTNNNKTSDSNMKVPDSVCIRHTWQRLLHHHAVAMEPREFASRIR